MSWAKRKFDQGLAELAAYGRFGLKDLQQRLAWGADHHTPSEPGMYGVLTPQEQYEEKNPEADRRPDGADWRQDFAAWQAERAAPAREPGKGLEKGE